MRGDGAGEHGNGYGLLPDIRMQYSVTGKGGGWAVAAAAAGWR